MWRRFEVELEKRGDHWGALGEALDTTGVALMLSALTTMAGFAVLLFSPMPIIQDFRPYHGHHGFVFAGLGHHGVASLG